jgi:hypothetical protein
MIPDSRTLEQDVAELPYCSYSWATEHVSTWIQPPISRQVFDRVEPTIIDGLYVQTRRLEIVPVIEPDLALELEAWEAASDEALMLFETECD